MIERIPPHNEEAERSVLGAAMLNKEVLFDILEEVREDDFYNESHKEIFRAIWELYRKNSAVDMLTVCEELKSRQSLDMVGGRAYIATLTAEVPATANGREYAKIIAEKAVMRQMIRTAEDITEKGYQSKMAAREILDYAESGIFQIAQRRQKNDYTKIQDVLLENLKIIDAAAQNKDKITGIPTGFHDLDEKTSGLQRSDLIIVAARPGMGKTAFALNIAQQSAVKHGTSAIIFSLEMSKEQLGQRLLAMQARVEMQKLKQGDLDRKDWDRVSLGVDELNNSKIVIDDTPGISLMEMRNKCRRLKAEQGLDLIVVDYLQLMTFEGRTDNRQQEISALSRNMKLLAREMNCPVILLSQLSRAPELRQDKRPMLSDLRESGSIEQDADIVMFLDRSADEAEASRDDRPDEGVTRIVVAKNRSGPIGDVDLMFLPASTKFYELDGAHTEE